MALEPPALPRMVLCLDGSILVLILTAATSSTGRAPLCQIAVACMGCASALLGLIVRRTGGNLGARGWAFLGAAFLGILALMFLLVGTAAAPAGRGILALWDVLTAAAQALAALFWRILVWVLTLFPAPENSVEGNPAAAPVEMPEELEELGPSPVAMLVLIVLLAVAVVWLAVWGLRMLGRFRIGGRAAARTVRTERERLSLLQALRRLLASWAAYVRGRVWLARSRNTPDGLFFLLVRRCRMGPWHKRPGETPREFLLRLRRSAEGDPQLAGALDELIPAVDAALYAPKGRSGRFSRARLVRRRVGAAVRRQFLRDSWDRMPWHKERDGGAN